MFLSSYSAHHLCNSLAGEKCLGNELLLTPHSGRLRRDRAIPFQEIWSHLATLYFVTLYVTRHVSTELIKYLINKRNTKIHNIKYKNENKNEGKIPKVLLSSGRLCLISVGVSGPARRGGPSLSEAGTGTTQSLSPPDTS